MLRKEVFGDDAVGRAGCASIDDAEHLAGALSPLRSHSRIGGHAPADGCCPETGERRQSIGRLFIERNDGSERSVGGAGGDADVKTLALQG